MRPKTLITLVALLATLMVATVIGLLVAETQIGWRDFILSVATFLLGVGVGSTVRRARERGKDEVSEWYKMPTDLKPPEDER